MEIEIDCVEYGDRDRSYKFVMIRRRILEVWRLRLIVWSMEIEIALISL